MQNLIQKLFWGLQHSDLSRDGIKPRFFKRPGSGPRPVLKVNYPVFSGPRIWIVKTLTTYPLGALKQKIWKYPIFLPLPSTVQIFLNPLFIDFR